MTNPRDAEALLSRLPTGARIAIVRLRSLGDCVLTTPAIALLKAHRPDLAIDVIVEPNFAAVFEGNPGIDRLLPRASRQPAPPDLVLNLHGGTRSMWITLASGAKFRAGFGHHRYSFLYTHKIPRAQEILGVERPVHTAEHVASAMFWLGVPQAEIPRAKLYAEPAPGEAPFAPPGRYAVIHPFASSVAKTWPAARFVELAAHLRDTAGVEPAFVFGPGEDTSPFAAFRAPVNPSIPAITRLISRAALFVGNDSGPAHIAAAFGVPSLVLFGPSEPFTWAPRRTESRILRSPAGASGISTAEAIEAVDQLRSIAKSNEDDNQEATGMSESVRRAPRAGRRS